MAQQATPPTASDDKFTYASFSLLAGRIAALIVFVAACVSIYIWLWGDTILGPRSDVRYSLIGPIRTQDGFTQGVWVINLGNKVAENVEVTITYANSEIRNTLYDQEKFLSQPTIDVGMSNRRIKLNFERVSQQEEGLIHLLLRGAEEQPKVSVRFDDKDGVEGVYKRSTSDKWIITVSIILNCIFASFLFRRISRKIKQE